MRPEKQTRIDIAKALAVASFVITGNEMNAVALDAMVEDLAPYGVAPVMDALARCRRECKGRLTLADILERMESADGRPEADEAWMNALLAVDEYATVIWTEETQQAFAIARPALEIHDRVGARMAFKAAYDRLVSDARAQNRPAKWSASLGFDHEQRRAALENAVQAGKLLPHHAIGLLPPLPADERITKAVLQLACINGDLIAPEVGEREKARQKIAELRAMLEKKSA